MQAIRSITEPRRLVLAVASLAVAALLPLAAPSQEAYGEPDLLASIEAGQVVNVTIRAQDATVYEYEVILRGADGERDVREFVLPDLSEEVVQALESGEVSFLVDQGTEREPAAAAVSSAYWMAIVVLGVVVIFGAGFTGFLIGRLTTRRRPAPTEAPPAE
jgi:hypothetical protein